MTRRSLLLGVACVLSLSLDHCCWASRANERSGPRTLADLPQSEENDEKGESPSVDISVAGSMSSQIKEIPAAWAHPGEGPDITSSESALIIGALGVPAWEHVLDTQQRSRRNNSWSFWYL